MIPKHQANFDRLRERGVNTPQVFERYGTKIREFYFCGWDEIKSFRDLIQSIQQYCSTDQLKNAKIHAHVTEVNFPIQFRKVERLEVHGGRVHSMSVQLSESLRYLTFLKENRKNFSLKL